MSATQDKSQKFKFVYSNMHQICKSGEPHELHGNVAVLKVKTPMQRLQDNLKELNRLHEELNKMLDELEKLVK